MTVDETIEEATHIIKEALPEASVYLYGSRARGDAQEYSDIDIAISLKDNKINSKELLSIVDKLDQIRSFYPVQLIDLNNVSKDFYKKVIVYAKEEKINDFKLAIHNLERSLNIDISIDAKDNNVFDIEKGEEILLLRDVVIKRFEICYDLAWKCLKHKLFEMGIDIQNPRAAYVEAVRSKILDDSSLWFDMISLRNSAAHSYDSELADSLYKEIPKYIDGLKSVYKASL